MSRALRIAVIEPSGNLYGSELCLLDILAGMTPERFAVRVFLPIGGAFASRLRDAGISFEEILQSGAATQNRHSKLFSYLGLFSALRHFRPDLVYVNEAGILRPIALMCRALQIPILCQVQTLEDARWVSKCPKAHGPVKAFICNSAFIAAETKVPENRKSTVYYGYRNKDLHRPRAAGNERFLVGLLGRICGSKGHDLVLDAAARLSAAGAGDIRFRFIGEAPNIEEAQEWRHRVRQRGLGALIEFRGYCSDIAPELADLDLMIVPSIAEPFGRILCEAAEARVPVLLSDSGGLGELSRRFDIGVRHRPRDVDALLRGIQQIRADYAAESERFATAAERLLGALDLNLYRTHVQSIIRDAALGHPVSRDWYGAETGDSDVTEEV
jgi:hypothetical protein